MLGWTVLAVIAIIASVIIPYVFSQNGRMFFNHNKVGKKIFALWLTLASLSIALWPTWLFLTFRAILSPVGFWQNLVLTGLGLYFLGFMQIIMLGLFLFFFFAVILGQKS